MDQDFHYYGAYYAAKAAGKFNEKEACLIAKASNFVDFLSNEKYGGYWQIVRDKQKPPPDKDYDAVASIEYPRYTFQGNLSTGFEASGGLWASFHFMPGNYNDPGNTPSVVDVHGQTVANLLPGFNMRQTQLNVDLKIDANIVKLLTRPQSALSRTLIQDTIFCLTHQDYLEKIILFASGGREILAENDPDDIIRRFGLMLLGLRAHVVADTWAHQDWCAADNQINSYWDVYGNVLYDQVYQRIEYKDIGEQWVEAHLSSTEALGNENFIAVPNATTYAGHGWMGHFPDYSFVNYRYKPCWRKDDEPVLERNNPMEYNYAFLELCSLFAQTQGRIFEPRNEKNLLNAAQKAISSACKLADENNCPYLYSAGRWMDEMEAVKIKAPAVKIDPKETPDQKAILDGQVHYDSLAETRYGTYYINYASDLYLFQIAADYQFHFVRNWLKTNGIGEQLFNDSWCAQLGPLSSKVYELFK